MHETKQPVTGFWAWDVKRDRVYGDSYLAEYFGLQPEELADGAEIGIFLSAMHPDDRSRVKSAIAVALRTKGQFRQQYRVLTASGEFRSILAAGQPIVDATGEVGSFPGWFIDFGNRDIGLTVGLDLCVAHIRQARDIARSLGQAAIQYLLEASLSEVKRQDSPIRKPKAPDGHG